MVTFDFLPQNFGMWWGPMNGICHSMNTGRVVRTFRGAGDTQILPSVNEFIQTF